MSRRIVMCACLGALCSWYSAQGMTLSELRLIVSEAQEPFSTGRLTYTEEAIDFSPKSVNDSKEERIREANKHRLIRNQVTVDLKNHRYRSSERDLRDIQLMMEAGQFGEADRYLIDQSKTVVVKGDKQLYFFSEEQNSRGPELDLADAPRTILGKLELCSFGLIRPEMISSDWDATISEKDVAGEPRLLMELVRQRGESTLLQKIECDPSVGYRFRRVQRYINGNLINEVVANEYQSSGGLPFPHKYVVRVFGGEGQVVQETRYNFEKVKLDVPVTEADFRVSAPAGTRVVDLVVGMREYTLEKAESLNAEDIMNRWAKQLAMDEIRKEGFADAIPTAKRQEWSMVLPPAEACYTTEQPFVLDLDRGALVYVRDGEELDWDRIGRHCVEVGKGDIAWGDMLIIFGPHVLKPTEEQANAIKVTTGRSHTTLQLMQDIEYPVEMVIRKSGSREYSVQLLGAGSDGMRIHCRYL